jgi:hypothetical protein
MVTFIQVRGQPAGRKKEKEMPTILRKEVFAFSSSAGKGLNLHIFTSNKRIEENREVFRLKWDEHFSQ